MSAHGIAEFLRLYAEVRAHLPYLPDVHVTDDLAPSAMTSDGRSSATAMVGAMEPDGRVRVQLAPESIPGRAITWHEAAHVAQGLVQPRLQSEFPFTDVNGQMVRAAFAARGAVIGSAPAYEQMASMLPECFIGEWGGYEHPLWGMDPGVVAPNVRAWYATAAAEAMRRWWLELMEWRPVAFVPPTTPTAPAPAPAPQPTPVAGVLRISPIWERVKVIPGGEFGADRSWVGAPAPPTHTGTDFACPVGTPVSALIRGRVIRAGWGDSLSGYIVRVLADDGRSILIAHLDRVVARAGDVVEADQVVAHSGNTGSATRGPHAHVEYCVEHLGHQGTTDCFRAGTLRDLMEELAKEDDMKMEDVDRRFREFMNSPEGTLLVRMAAYRTDAENLAKHPPELRAQLAEQLSSTARNLRDWVKGLWT